LDNLFSGLFSYATTMFILSLYNLQAQGITIPNAIVGMACFVGGLAQFAAGMWGMSLTTFSPEDTID